METTPTIPPPPPPPLPPPRRFSRFLTFFPLANASLTITSYLLVLLCAVGMIAGVLIASYGTSHAVKHLQGLGIFLFIASVVWANFIIIPAAIFLSATQIGSLALSAIAVNRAVRPNTPRSRRAFAIAGLLLSTVLVSIFLVALAGIHAQSIAKRHRLDADYILRIAHDVSFYRDDPTAEPTFAPAIAATFDSFDPDMLENHIAIPTGAPHHSIIPPGTPHSDWPKYAAAIDDASDFRYVGANLPILTVGNPLRPRLIILYNKAPYDGGRTIAFADMSYRFVKSSDLPALFADNNAARAALHFPPITLDAPPPPLK